MNTRSRMHHPCTSSQPQTAQVGWKLAEHLLSPGNVGLPVTEAELLPLTSAPLATMPSSLLTTRESSENFVKRVLLVASMRSYVLLIPPDAPACSFLVSSAGFTSSTGSFPSKMLDHKYFRLCGPLWEILYMLLCFLYKPLKI